MIDDSKEPLRWKADETLFWKQIGFGRVPRNVQANAPDVGAALIADAWRGLMRVEESRGVDTWDLTCGRYPDTARVRGASASTDYFLDLLRHRRGNDLQ